MIYFYIVMALWLVAIIWQDKYEKQTKPDYKPSRLYIGIAGLVFLTGGGYLCQVVGERIQEEKRLEAIALNDARKSLIATYKEHPITTLQVIDNMINEGQLDNAATSLEFLSTIDDKDVNHLKNKLSKILAKQRADIELAKFEKAQKEAEAEYRELFTNEGMQYSFISDGEAAIRYRLKDPNSAEFRDTYFNHAIVDKKDVAVVCGYVNSKNSYGGYTGFQRFVATQTVAYVESDARDFHVAWNGLCL